MTEKSETAATMTSTAHMLSEALPYMRKYAGQTIVIKFGGHAMGDDALSEKFARDIVLMKQVGMNPVVVHGGGPQIGRMLDRLKIKSEFVNGLRVTDRETVDIVEMVLSGAINKSIVNAINQAGGKAVGLSGKDCNMVQARKMLDVTTDPDSNIEKVLDLGFVGEIVEVNPHVVNVLTSSDLIPVIAPIGVGEAGETYNINADTVAGAVASALKAKRLLLLTDVKGVLDGDGQLITDMSAKQARDLVEEGIVKGGMIPKLATCLESVEAGVSAAVILDGRVEHAVLLELFTDHGVGTLIEYV
jgi:acetylglutamate kinase